MTATRQTQLPLAVRLRSNILRAPWFFLSTGFFGSLSLLASCFEKRWPPATPDREDLGPGVAL